MCGIAGLIDQRARDAEASCAQCSTRCVSAAGWRGPHVEPGVALGARLSVIDLATGWQPLAARRQVLAFQNGEIYNYRALRVARARRRAFRTASDTEVLAHGYDRWGIDGLLARIDGMYALAILDRGTRVLHLARDRFGESRVLRRRCGTLRLRLRSADTGAAVGRDEHDPLSLRRYLALHYVPGDATIYRHARACCRANVWRSARRARAEAFPLLRSAARRRGALPDEALTALVEHAVASGSSPMCRSACSVGRPRQLGHRRGRARHLRRAHVLDGFRQRRTTRANASELAAAIGSRHHHFRFDEQSFASLLPQVADALDEPLGDQALLPVFGSHARRAVTRRSCCPAKGRTRSSPATATTARSRRSRACCRRKRALAGAGASARR
jgi:asparagine synthase (glutamine-hydrolysing)